DDSYYGTVSETTLEGFRVNYGDGLCERAWPGSQPACNNTLCAELYATINLRYWKCGFESMQTDAIYALHYRLWQLIVVAICMGVGYCLVEGFRNDTVPEFFDEVPGRLTSWPCHLCVLVCALAPTCAVAALLAVFMQGHARALHDDWRSITNTGNADV